MKQAYVVITAFGVTPSLLTEGYQNVGGFYCLLLGCNSGFSYPK